MSGISLRAMLPPRAKRSFLKPLGSSPRISPPFPPVRPCVRFCTKAGGNGPADSESKRVAFLAAFPRKRLLEAGCCVEAGERAGVVNAPAQSLLPAVRAVTRYQKGVPSWPQLPRRGSRQRKRPKSQRKKRGSTPQGGMRHGFR